MLDVRLLQEAVEALNEVKRGPAPDAIKEAPYLQLWMPALAKHSSIVLCGFVRCHPLLDDRLVATSMLLHLDVEKR